MTNPSGYLHVLTMSLKAQTHILAATSAFAFNERVVSGRAERLERLRNCEDTTPLTAQAVFTTSIVVAIGLLESWPARSWSFAVSSGFKREAIPIKNHDVQSLIRWIHVPCPCAATAHWSRAGRLRLIDWRRAGDEAVRPFEVVPVKVTYSICRCKSTHGFRRSPRATPRGEKHLVPSRRHLLESLGPIAACIAALQRVGTTSANTTTTPRGGLVTI